VYRGGAAPLDTPVVISSKGVIMKYLCLILITLMLTACAMTPQGHWVAPTTRDANRVQDHVECLAIAAQGAQGYGAFFRDRMMREGMYNAEKEKLYNLCVQSRGYSFQVAR
jgi:hypothetical protein